MFGIKAHVGKLSLPFALGIIFCAQGFIGCKERPQPRKAKAQPNTKQRGSQKPSPARKRPLSPLAKKNASPKTSASPKRASGAQKLAWKRHLACMAKHPRCPKTGRTKVALWLHDKKAALSLTYDDSMPVQYNDIYPIQKRYGFKGTFFLYTRELLMKRSTHWGQSIRNWPHWRKIQADGNEIGSHSVSHPYLSKIPFARAKKELVDSCRTIKKYIPKARCETIAYPYGDSDERVRRFARRYYLAGRQAKRGINPPNPPDMMNVLSVIPTMTTSVPKMESWIKRSMRKKGWTAWMFHGTKGQGWEPLTLKRFDVIFKLISRYRKQLWVGNFGDVSKYIFERQKTKLSTPKASASGIELSMRNKLDKRFTQPLTLLIALPSRWRKIATRQGKTYVTSDAQGSKMKGCPCLRQHKVQGVPNRGTMRIYPRNVGF